jgi:glycosyltransferase involved in cell wall biosynthesis
MKILISSYSFFPSIGGLETVSAVLAREFACAGHLVKLVTQTRSTEVDGFPFEVIRRPLPARLFDLVRWCDVYFQNNISLLMAWPLALVHRPWVVAHQIWLSPDWKGQLKRFLLRFAIGVSISRAIAADFPPSVVIPDPYDNTVFYERSEIYRERDLIYVGRLISDKGVHLVLEALTNLRSQGQCLTLTIVGSGPEEVALRRLAQQLGLDDQVCFAGVQRGHNLARLLNAHRVMVVPSIWLEPFGIVALEGIACGCIVVGSEGGGLKDAIGPCGLTFPNGDVEALTRCLANLFDNPECWTAFRAAAADHLAQHTPAAVASAYLRILEGVNR